MNAMLLAAGRGERMEPLSSVVAKPALEVLGEPLCATAVRQLARFGDTLVVNLHRHPRQVAAAVREVLGDRRVFFSWEPVLLGGAGGLARARRLFGPGPLLVGNGDTVSALDLAPLAAPADPECCTLGLLPHPDPRRWSSVELASDGRVRTIFPAGAADGGDLFLFTGFQVLGAEVLACLPSPPGELAPVWQRLREAGRLRGVVLRGEWQEAGTPRGFLDLVLDRVGPLGWRHPQAILAEDAVLEHSAVGRGCGVGRGCRLMATVVTAGASIGPRSEIEGCVVAGAFALPAGTRARDELLLPGGRYALPPAGATGQRA
ncbi:MAG TPA: sugar phosphate nucleotidyltransferase [Thermoanaerobaculaceae bacterium]|nr:sugar phosphate nucleotidyltransferase [Thermoanaerobaculaceae bacterium]